MPPRVYMGQNEFPPEPTDFTTTDLHTAAYLTARGTELVDTVREGRRLRFCFPPEARDTAKAYMNSDERLFADALRTLKAATYHF